MFQSVSINSSYKVNLQIPKSQKGEKTMTDHEKLVMRNIIYAVETGGQVYGQKNYADFTEAYTNSSSEHAITIGAGQ